MRSTANIARAPDMDNTTLSASLLEECPPPFLDAAKFGSGGCTFARYNSLDCLCSPYPVVGGRFCAPMPQAPSLLCCLPCPSTDFLYPDSKRACRASDVCHLTYPAFKKWYRVAEGLNLAGLVALLFLFITYLFLPPAKTRRHYLSFCLIVGAMVLNVSPAIEPPKHALLSVLSLVSLYRLQYDPRSATTPSHRMTCFRALHAPFQAPSSWPVALPLLSGVRESGQVFTARADGLPVFIRALSMHLQICWDAEPGRKFFYASQILGWGVAAVFFTITITLTGVSFRFGDVCHVNSSNSMKDFWGPLLGISGAAMLLQLCTYVASLLSCSIYLPFSISLLS